MLEQSLPPRHDLKGDSTRDRWRTVVKRVPSTFPFSTTDFPKIANVSARPSPTSSTARKSSTLLAPVQSAHQTPTPRKAVPCLQDSLESVQALQPVTALECLNGFGITKTHRVNHIHYHLRNGCTISPRLQQAPALPLQIDIEFLDLTSRSICLSAIWSVTLGEASRPKSGRSVPALPWDCRANFQVPIPQNLFPKTPVGIHLKEIAANLSSASALGIEKGGQFLGHWIAFLPKLHAKIEKRFFFQFGMLAQKRGEFVQRVLIQIGVGVAKPRLSVDFKSVPLGRILQVRYKTTGKCSQ